MGKKRIGSLKSPMVKVRF